MRDLLEQNRELVSTDSADLVIRPNTQLEAACHFAEEPVPSLVSETVGHLQVAFRSTNSTATRLLVAAGAAERVLHAVEKRVDSLTAAAGAIGPTPWDGYVATMVAGDQGADAGAHGGALRLLHLTERSSPARHRQIGRGLSPGPRLHGN